MNGVDVAKDAAKIILLEKDLAVLNDGIVEGRRVPVELYLAFGQCVPVLSLHRISMLPKSSIAESCLTRTFFFVIRRAPWASVTVIIIGIISGVMPTPRATEKRKDSRSGGGKQYSPARQKAPIA